MVDIHSHLIPNIDDGSGSIEETVAMLNEAKQAGFTDIILTSHYMEKAYENKPEIIELWTEQLKKIVNNENLDINLYTGNELYISDNIEELIRNKQVLTLANSMYLLMELPLNSYVQYVGDAIFTLRAMHITPIIAHPERYSYVQDNIDFVQVLINQGCLIQCNYASIIGVYGRKAEKTVKKLLKMDLVHFLGSDCHKPNTIYKKMPKIIAELKKVTTEEQLNCLTTEDPKKILRNEI